MPSTLSFLDAADIVGAIRRDPNVSPAFAAALGTAEIWIALLKRRDNTTAAFGPFPTRDAAVGWSRDNPGKGHGGYWAFILVTDVSAQ